MSAAIGAHIPFGRFFPEGLLPVALGQAPDLQAYDKNAALIVLGDKPFVAKTGRTCSMPTSRRWKFCSSAITGWFPIAPVSIRRSGC